MRRAPQLAASAPDAVSQGVTADDVNPSSCSDSASIRFIGGAVRPLSSGMPDTQRNQLVIASRQAPYVRVGNEACVEFDVREWNGIVIATMIEEDGNVGR